MNWKKSNKHSFEQTLRAGHEADGRPLFVTQTMHGLGNVVGGGSTPRSIFDRLDGAYIGVTIDEDGNVSPDGGQIPTTPNQNLWHIGKAGVHLARGVTYSYGGAEYDSTGHYVFAPPDPERYIWVTASNGAIPKDAVAGWNGSERQVVARMQWAGGVHPGKLIPSSRACFIGYGGREKASQSYEVLVRRA